MPKTHSRQRLLNLKVATAAHTSCSLNLFPGFRGGMVCVGLGLTEAWQLLETAQTDPWGNKPPVEQTPPGEQRPRGRGQI